MTHRDIENAYYYYYFAASLSPAHFTQLEEFNCRHHAPRMATISLGATRTVGAVSLILIFLTHFLFCCPCEFLQQNCSVSSRPMRFLTFLSLKKFCRNRFFLAAVYFTLHRKRKTKNERNTDNKHTRYGYTERTSMLFSLLILK